MELNTSQPHHAEIVSKPSRNPILYVVLGVVVVVIAALGLLVWQKNQEIAAMINQLADAEKRVTDINDSAKDKTDDVSNAPKAVHLLSEVDQKKTAITGAADYYCAVRDFGCDDVVAQVTKFQKATETTDGFAVVSAVNADGQRITPWLKYRVGGSGWVVIYEGDALPSPAMIEQFSIPTDLLAVY